MVQGRRRAVSRRARADAGRPGNRYRRAAARVAPASNVPIWMRRAGLRWPSAAGVAALVAISPVIVGPWKIGTLLSVSVCGEAAHDCHDAGRAADDHDPARLSARGASVHRWRFTRAPPFSCSSFSLGPFPTLAGRRVLFRAPYAWLMELPGYSSIRVPARFGMLFILCLAVAAGCAFAWLTDRFSPYSRRILAAARRDPDRGRELARGHRGCAGLVRSRRSVTARPPDRSWSCRPAWSIVTLRPCIVRWIISGRSSTGTAAFSAALPRSRCCAAEKTTSMRSRSWRGASR